MTISKENMMGDGYINGKIIISNSSGNEPIEDEEEISMNNILKKIEKYRWVPVDEKEKERQKRERKLFKEETEKSEIGNEIEVPLEEMNKKKGKREMRVFQLKFIK